MENLKEFTNIKLGTTSAAHSRIGFDTYVPSAFDTFRIEWGTHFSALHPTPPIPLRGRGDIQQWAQDHGSFYGYPNRYEWQGLVDLKTHIEWAQNKGMNFAMGSILTRTPSLSDPPSWIEYLPRDLAVTYLMQHLNIVIDFLATFPAVYKVHIINECFTTVGNLNVNDFWAFKNTFNSTTESRDFYRGVIVKVIKRIRSRIPSWKPVLSVNDNGILYGEVWPGQSRSKATGLYYEIERWKDAGAKIDAVNAQGHLWLKPDGTEPIGARALGYQRVFDLLNAFKSPGYQTGVSEFDVAIGGTLNPENYYNEQGSIYEEVVQAVKDTNSEMIFWGLEDGTSWRRYLIENGEYTDPCLFYDVRENPCSDNFCKKPAFQKTLEVLQS